MDLSDNQAALILGMSDDGEISVDVAGSDMEGLPGALCQAIAMKLMQDERFQAELMEIVDNQG
ncbi:MAG: twitching motility protein [Desulfobulbaceae bacterium]|nr:twitching motility protein [Desulfobulbaceae bacterium]